MSEDAAAGPITVALCGDVMLGRAVNECIAQAGSAYPWGDVLTVREEADLFLINLECALTAETAPGRDGGEKPFHFRADPAAVETLRAGRVDFAGIANNHILDFGVAGLMETLSVLDAAGIARAGAGADLAAARRPAVLEAGGLRIAVVASADYPAAWAASERSAGLNFVRIAVDEPSFAAVRGAIAEARRLADCVVFCIHWGPNMRERPTAAFRAFARRVIEAGASVFWGHSAHVVQGIEFYRQGVILYDSGDFIDDYAVDPWLRNDLSALFLLRIGAAGVEEVRLLPVRIDDMRVGIATEADRAWLLRRLSGLCAELGSVLLPARERGPVRVQRLEAASPAG